MAKQKSSNVTDNRKPRILIVTPEITYLPSGMGNMACRLTAKAGGLADVSASLVAALFDLGADVHVALPHYRRMFHVEVGQLISDELRVYKSRLPDTRIHLAEDRCFYYRDTVYSYSQNENPKLALAFSREVINNIIPTVQPDLIHCNDWMTGLIPGAARRMGIPCLFTVHNIHTHRLTLAQIEDSGIDAAEFWSNLYYTRVPYNYEESRNSNEIDMQASGVFASHFINTVSPTFLKEIVNGWHDFIPRALREEIRNKDRAGCAAGILNAPDAGDNPAADPNLEVNYTPETHREAKRANKIAFQHKVGLEEDPDVPLFFWPSRLDPAQKGPQLLADILYRFMSRHWKRRVQIAIVANGSFQQPFYDILRHHDLYGRLAVCDFN
ncbi:MAG TPA: glycogen/starch synthase, partial [Kiritimatiellia bacterium]|nr:glycogen/starch synthase [Kiritimatiellia bacterium]